MPEPGGPDQQDVALGEFDLVARAHALGAAGLQALVVVVDRHRQDALGALLADDVLVEDFLDFLGLGELVAGALGALLELLADDVVAELDALVADEYGRSGDELPNFVLALSTEGAVQQLSVIMFAARIFAHAVLKLTAPRRSGGWHGDNTDYIAPGGLRAKISLAQAVTGAPLEHKAAADGRIEPP